MSVKRLLLIGAAIYVGGAIILYAVFGSEGKNDEFEPQEEFRLTPWVHIKIGGLDLSINRAVFYLFLACILTCAAMVYIAKRMQQKPNKTQTAVELAYDLTRNNITRGNLHDPKMATKWFTFIATLFFFIWISNLLGYIPLPTNTHEKVDIFGVDIPSFALYAATANLSVPLVLALIVFVSYNVEGVRAKGFVGYLKALIPQGVKGGMAAFILVLEFM